MTERWAMLDDRYYRVSKALYFVYGNADTNFIIRSKYDKRGAFLDGDLYGDPRKWKAVKGWGEHYAEVDPLINRWIGAYRAAWDAADAGDEDAKKKIEACRHGIDKHGWYFIM